MVQEKKLNGEPGMWIKNNTGRVVFVGETLGNEMIKNKQAVAASDPSREGKKNEK